MSEINRYDLEFDGDHSIMEIDSQGEWCKYEDVEKLIPQWISVKDRLPEESYVVDVYCRSHDNPDYGRRKTEVLYKEGTFMTSLYGDCEYVSHWQPLPSPPKEESE